MNWGRAPVEFQLIFCIDLTLPSTRFEVSRHREPQDARAPGGEVLQDGASDLPALADPGAVAEEEATAHVTGQALPFEALVGVGDGLALKAAKSER